MLGSAERALNMRGKREKMRTLEGGYERLEWQPRLVRGLGLLPIDRRWLFPPSAGYANGSRCYLARKELKR